MDIGEHYMSGFVKHHLECAHGDLGLQSQASLPPEERCALPPLSPLGLALRAPATEATVHERVETLIEQTAGNISIALLRLEDISFGKTVDVVGTVSDRLPPNIVASFDAGMDHIAKRRDTLRRNLGLKAIQIVGKDGTSARVRFSDLREKILEGWNLSEKSRLCTLLESEDAMEELLSASNGYLQLWYNFSDEPCIEFFHQDFGTYVCDNYGNSLAEFALQGTEEVGGRNS